MAWSDKKLVNEARKRFDRLNKSGLNTDTLEILKNNLNVFYDKNKKVRKTSMSGISIKKSMTVKERKEMRQILRSFLKGDESKVSQIKREYDRVFNRYEDSTRKKHHRKVKGYSEMLGELGKLKRILEDRKALSYLGSPVLKEVWERAEEEGWSTDMVRDVLSQFVEQMEMEEENGVLVSRTSNDIINSVFEEIESRVNAYDGII